MLQLARERIWVQKSIKPHRRGALYGQYDTIVSNGHKVYHVLVNNTQQVCSLLILMRMKIISLALITPTFTEVDVRPQQIIRTQSRLRQHRFKASASRRVSNVTGGFTDNTLSYKLSYIKVKNI